MGSHTILPRNDYVTSPNQIYQVNTQKRLNLNKANKITKRPQYLMLNLFIQLTCSESCDKYPVFGPSNKIQEITWKDNIIVSMLNLHCKTCQEVFMDYCNNNNKNITAASEIIKHFQYCIKKFSASNDNGCPFFIYFKQWFSFLLR